MKTEVFAFVRNSQFHFVENLKLIFNGFLWASSAYKFSVAKMARETKKPLAKMGFLLICG